MSPTTILSQNLAKIFEITGTSASRMSALCFEAGLTESASALKTTFSRLLNNDANIRMDSLEAIYEGIKRLPGFENFRISDLFDENFVTPRIGSTIDAVQLEGFISQLLFDLQDLQWIEMKQDPAMATAVGVLLAKKHGIDVVKKDDQQQFVASR